MAAPPSALPAVRAARPADRRAWDAFATRTRGGSLLSTWGWGELKRRQGWTVERLLVERADGELQGLLWLQLRRGPAGVAFAYAPRGPLLDDLDRDAPAGRALIRAAAATARRHRALLLKLDPEWPEDDPGAIRLLRECGARPSWYDVQHRKTYLVDLHGGPEAVLARLKESTRRAIRKCERSGVETEVTADPDAAALFHPLLLESGRRNRFVPREERYYADILREVGPSCPAVVVLGRHEGAVVGAMIALAVGPRLVYLYGGNRLVRGGIHPAYAVQWAAMRWGMDVGCTTYDMWGVPNHEDPTVPGYGYYEFKTRFNGRVVRHLRCQEVRLWPLGPLPTIAERVALRGRPLLT